MVRNSAIKDEAQAASGRCCTTKEGHSMLGTLGVLYLFGFRSSERERGSGAPMLRDNRDTRGKASFQQQ